MMVETILESSQEFGMASGPLPQWKRELLQRRAARGRPPPAPAPAPQPAALAPDEDLRYGPGIVKRLKSRYLSLALRDAPRRRPSVLRRAASLEQLEPPAAPPAPPPAPAPRRDYVKRARSVDALSRLEARSEPPPSPAPPTPPALPAGRAPRAPRRPAPLLRDTERPPPDVVRSTLRKFEPRPAPRGPPAVRVLRTRSPSPAAEPVPRVVSRAALDGIARAGHSTRYAFEAPRHGSHLPPLAAANPVLLRRVGVIRPMPATPRESSPPATLPPRAPPVEEPARREAPPAAVVEPQPRSPALPPPLPPRPPPSSFDTLSPELDPKFDLPTREDNHIIDIVNCAVSKLSDDDTDDTSECKIELLEAKNPDMVKPSEVVKYDADRVAPVAVAVPASPVTMVVAPQPAVPVVPTVPLVPAVPVVPTVPLVPAVPVVPTVPLVPAVPVVPTVPLLPAVPVVPVAPAIPVVPAVPAVPSVPTVPSIPAAPLMPRMGVGARRPAVGTTSVVFNFSHRKEVPDYIENDGLVLRRARPQTGPTASGEECEEIEERAPSPCSVRFVNDNVLINGRSSMPARPDRTRIARLKLQFDDSLTRTFEYPSETSMCEDDPPAAPVTPETHVSGDTPLAANTHIVSAALSRYTPSKTCADAFTLGVTRRPPPAAALNGHTNGNTAAGAGAGAGAGEEAGDARPCGADARAFSDARALNTDLLF